MLKNWIVRDVVSIVVGVAALVALGYGLERVPITGMAYYNFVIMSIGINIILAVSLNIINGHAGQFSMGHAGFMAVGAYGSAFLTFYYFGPYVDGLAEGPYKLLMQHALFFVAIVAGGLLAAFAGYLVGLPSLRLRGDYLAIVTLGFGEVIRVIILNVDKVGAQRGLSGVPKWSNFTWVFIFAVATILISHRLVSSSIGRAFLSVREDEIASEAMGVNTTHYKVQAFVLGAFFAGVAGGLFGHHFTYLNPQSFTFIKSFEVIVMVVLGGMGSISGAVFAAVILTVALEGLRMVKEWFSLTTDPRMVIYAVLLIILMRVRPQGLLGHREIWQWFGKRRKDRIGGTTETASTSPEDPSGPPITGGGR